MVIENVTFSLASLGKTVSVNVTVPLFTSFLTMSLPSKVPVKLPRSVPSVTSVTVMGVPRFAKLGLPVVSAILRDVIPIGSASIIVMILVRLSPGFPALSASAVYV